MIGWTASNAWVLVSMTNKSGTAEKVASWFT
jgi:hypothetical protein